MTVEKFPSSQEIAYRKAVAEWRKIMAETPGLQVPKENVEAAAEEMARYWIVINDVPERYCITVETPSDIPDEDRKGINERVMEDVKRAIDPYVSALNYSKDVIYHLVLQKYGVTLNFEPGMLD
ncbi:hypothetical protein N619_03355 [Ectopseudomonas oleovorans]|nr:hypothetical protein N619_03355 [Pseudomonas oleovorans]